MVQPPVRHRPCSSQPTSEPVTWHARLFLAVTAALQFLLAALAVNQDHIALQFLTWQTPQISVFWWLLGAFILGLLLGLFGITLLTTKLNLRSRRLSKQLGEAEGEVRKLRNMTLHE